MVQNVKRIFVEKKKGFDVEAQSLYRDLKFNLGITGLESVRIINRYDVDGVTDAEYKRSRHTVFSEPPVDLVFDETFDFDNINERHFAIEYLPGQYDQRADSAAQCIQILTQRERPTARVAKLILLHGDISDPEYQKIKDYCINPVECREASWEKPVTLETVVKAPEDVSIMIGFTKMPPAKLEILWKDMGLAMSLEDLKFCQAYFKDTEHRDPTITEIRVIDTYWSDHCRHTTFLTQIENVKIEPGVYADAINNAYHGYLASRKYVYGEREKDLCLMDLATIAMKELRKKGKLSDLEISDEVNACTIVVNVDIDGRTENGSRRCQV